MHLGEPDVLLSVVLLVQNCQLPVGHGGKDEV